MSIDLANILTGGLAARIEAARSEYKTGSILLTFRCKCAATLARVHGSPRGLILVGASSRKFTRPHTARIVLDAAFDDLDTLLSMPDLDAHREEQAVSVGAFLETVSRESLEKILPPLMLPPRPVFLENLDNVYEQTQEGAKQRGLVPGLLEPLDSACNKCRVIYYLGDQLTDWIQAKPRNNQIIANTPHKYSRMYVPTWPHDALNTRVTLYRHILSTAC